MLPKLGVISLSYGHNFTNIFQDEKFIIFLCHVLVCNKFQASSLD